MEPIYVGDLLPSIASYKKIIEKYDKGIKEGEFYEEMIEKNYDNPSEILQIINQHKELVHKHVILFNLPETLKS